MKYKIPDKFEVSLVICRTHRHALRKLGKVERKLRADNINHRWNTKSKIPVIEVGEIRICFINPRTDPRLLAGIQIENVARVGPRFYYYLCRKFSWNYKELMFEIKIRRVRR